MARIRSRLPLALVLALSLAALPFAAARNPDGQGFAVFGRVVAGMEVVRRIQAAPAEGQALTPPIEILRARRRSAP